MASPFTHVTVVPAAILRSAGTKARLPRNSAPIGIVMDDDDDEATAARQAVAWRTASVTVTSKRWRSRRARPRIARLPIQQRDAMKTSDPPMCLTSGRFSNIPDE